MRIPDNNTLTSNSPQSLIIVKDIVDEVCVADVNLVRLPQEWIIPDLQQGVITNTVQQMVVNIEINAVYTLSMEGLHLYFHSILRHVISSNGSVFKYDPQLVAFAFQFFDHSTGEYFAEELESFQVPNIDMSASVSYDVDGLRIIWKTGVLIFAGQLDG